MRFQGTLSAWNPDAGVGRIRPSGGGEEVFVSLAAFPTDGDGPRLDEPLSFEIVTGRDGRKQAIGLKRVQGARVSSAALREAAGVGRLRLRQSQKRRRVGLAAGAIVALVLVVGGAQLWQPQAGGEVRVGLRR
jgi:cold shock CspA family protein